MHVCSEISPAVFSFTFKLLLNCVLFQREEVPDDYFKHDPDHKHIYRFVRTLFSAAQLTAECAIVTLVSLGGEPSYHHLAFKFCLKSGFVS